ncbi:tetratricopeptide repeat protein [Photobacterium sanctipauli]|uniref:Tetratricopeptide repeat protein n=1 Tax=Photobacterium sanctipauli TaxID=1342794 RepID=A0A2T3NQ14_9GAMM|nr:tetratricopeptide repeat protein [Photobacterium sanctipauli]PSW18338.1 tetratricopeptide repeat protein [Photobacterium sanctipauli]
MKASHLFIIAALFLTGCATAPSEQQHVENLTKANNHQGLIDHYRQQLQHNPGDGDIMLALAESYLQLNDTESANFYVEHQLNAGLQHPKLYLLAGKIASRESRYQQSLDFYQQAKLAGYQDPDLYVLQGVSYSYLNDYRNAEAAFNQARLAGHNDITIKNNLAVIHLAQHQYSQVVDMLLPVYQNHPENRQVRTNLALAFVRLGDYTQARQLLSPHHSEQEMVALFSVLTHAEEI